MKSTLNRVNVCLAAALALGAITFASSQTSYAAERASSAKVDSDLDKSAIDQCLADAAATGTSKECDILKTHSSSKKDKVAAKTAKLKVEVKTEKDAQGNDVKKLEATVTAVEKCIKCGTEEKDHATVTRVASDLEDIRNSLMEKISAKRKDLRATVSDAQKQFDKEEACKATPDGDDIEAGSEDQMTCLHEKLADKADDEKAQRAYFEKNVRPMIDAQLSNTTDPLAAARAQAYLAKFKDVATEGTLQTEMQLMSTTAELKLAPAAHAAELNDIKLKFKSAFEQAKGNPQALAQLKKSYEASVTAADTKFNNQNATAQTQLAALQSNPKVMLDAGLSSSVALGLTTLNTNSAAYQAELDARKALRDGKKAKSEDDDEFTDAKSRLGRFTRDANKEQKAQFCDQHPGACDSKNTVKVAAPLAAGAKASTVQTKSTVPAQRTIAPNTRINM